ncbi:MAG: GatB/YqeY domain-containing protein [Nitrosomonas sp.]|nr:GatB/YqeY domain-containing protein [Nitrosomonas sp.]
MSLKQQVAEDMKAAMRAGDARRRDAIRLLQANIKQREVDARIELSDADVVAIIEKMLKQRKDSIAQFEAAKREDLAEIEKYEVSVLTTYMPKAMSEEEVDAIVIAAISSSGAAGPQDMGKVMAIIKPKLAGRADMGKVSALVKAKISG